VGGRLAAGLRRAAADAGVPIQVLGDGPVLQVFFTDARPLRNHRDLLRADKNKAVAFGHELIRQGIYCTPGGKLYLSLAHSDQDIDRTVEAATMALRTLR
jgi:glutamate-1-semialdehyde 2,1-aminomutase